MLYVDLDAAASEAIVRSARGARVARCTCSMLASCIELLVLQICSSALWLVRSVSSGLLLVVEFLHGGRGSRHGPARGVGLELQVARLLVQLEGQDLCAAEVTVGLQWRRLV